MARGKHQAALYGQIKSLDANAIENIWAILDNKLMKTFGKPFANEFLPVFREILSYIL